ncbi:MAG TPA: hypothetical protein VHA75_02140, partial [Rugosimonospora sp.]|nr:hypothetical protein [Rugosimonospora sp.]
MKNRVSRRTTAMLARTCTAAGALAALLAFGASAKAQVCAGYSITSGPGTFIPGTDDTGNHCDDCVTAINLPFAVNFYGTSYNSASVGSNGTFQFVTANATYVNACWPANGIQTGFGPTIFPFWDDLYTSGTAAGQGIFTNLSGAPGSQVFVVEWRTNYCCNTAAPVNDFELVFYENHPYIDIVYSTPMSDRASATIGVQDGNGQFVQYECNATGPASGTSLHVACLNSATAGACCNPTAGTCAVTNQTECSPAANFQGIGTSCPGSCPGQGACCDLAAGTCTLGGAAGCTSPLAFQGVGSVCTTNPCQGACCNPATGGCTMTGSAGCVSPSVFQSAGTSCSPSNPCPQPPPPSNDLCSTVLTALSPTIPPNGGTVNGTTAAAVTDGNANCGSGGYRDVYYVFTPAMSGSYTLDLCQTAPSFDTVLSIHSGCPADASTILACDDDSTCGLLSTLQYNNFTAGTHYIIRVADYTTEAGFTGGPFVLNVVFNVSGACCDSTNGACTVSTTGAAGCASGTTYQGDNTLCNASACPGLGTCCSPAGSCSVQYTGSCAAGLTPSTGISCTPTQCTPSAGTVCENFDTGTVGSLPNNWTT